MSEFSKVQKRVLGQLANQAWKALSAEERAAIVDRASEALGDPFGVSASVAFCWWRHRVQTEVTGRSSMLVMDQDDFGKMKAHWLFLCDRIPAAATAAKRSQDNPGRQFYWLIKTECQKRGLKFPAYPAAICRAQYKCELSAATADQLKRILFTVRSRRPSTK